VCRHHHRAFARSAICGARNLREISATSPFADIAPPFRISPTDSGLRRLGKEMCADIIIARLLGQPSAVPGICGEFQPPAHSPRSRRRSGCLPQIQDSAD
jgi:hypothetical protein